MIWNCISSRWIQAMALACCLTPLSLSCAHSDEVPTPADSQLATTQKQVPPRALWAWNAGVITQPTQRDSLLDFCRSKKIGIIYLHLGDFLSGTKRNADDPKHVTADALGSFLETAHAKGLRVEALDGDPSFTLAAKHDEALKRLQGAITYNRGATASRRLDGFQWDIEPYVMKEFRDEAQHASIVGQFLDIVKKSRDLVQAEKDIAGAKGFWLGFALPFWMDGEAQAVTWNGEKRPATFHALEILKPLPHSYVALMAYRDKAEGDNGTIGVVKGEMEYAARNTPGVLIVVGQETGAVKTDPASITFYEEGEGPLETAVGQIDTAYAASPVYGGVAIHHLDSYRDLIARLPMKSAAASTIGKGEASLTVNTPSEGDKADLNTPVSGKATGGDKVQLSVKPEGDIWYESPAIGIGADGSWSSSVRLGNDKTVAGKKFAIRVRLQDAEGKALQEKQFNVVR